MKKQLIAIVTTAFIATGCASSGASPAMSSNTAVLPPMSDVTTVEVHNNNWSDMVVYAVRYNSRYRLGMVTSMNSKEFKLPRTLHSGATDLQLLAEPIGPSERYLTDAIQLNPGQRVEFRIENLLAISNWAVW